MSKKHRKQRARRKFLKIMLAIGGMLPVLAVLLATLFTAQGKEQGGTPEIVVDQPRIEQGDLSYGTIVTFEIKVTNRGNGVLKFQKPPYIEIVKGCCPPRLTVDTVVLGPGESTFVRSLPYTMHEGMGGPHHFAVHLKTNDPDNPDLIVDVLANWVPAN